MTRLWMRAGVVLFVCLQGLTALASPPVVPDLTPDRGKDAPLPKYMTEAEKLLPPLAVPRDRAAPTGSVYCPPEYDPMEGLFFAWEGYTSTITSMVVPMTTNDPPATAFVVVDSSSEQSSAYSSLSGSGADMAHVEFIVRATNSVWIDRKSVV